MATPESPVESIFFAALAKASDEERAAYLTEACAGNQDLRRRVERLLQAHPKVGSFLQGDSPGPAVTVDEPSFGEAAGTVIGPYKLLQQLGEGGMGTVFLAEQTQPVQRKVALKLIKSGMDSGPVLARFEAERQALALMDHPNIARVFDGGTTEGGRPYFVMELVKGVPITCYCDEHHLTPRQRLELFVPVCQAVQHAHQKGIIHRDLKPSNVLVCLYDSQPVPKVIDFGVAKAAGPRLTDKTLFTEIGQVVGTLEYMSPEQAQLNRLDIDTRSDIYSLGVLLYELLTGTTPLERKRFQAVAFLEVLRLIREEESPKPSTRLSTTEGLPSIAANRGLEPKKLSGLVRGELDWIVMRALEKDRNRRYDTANGFAMDVQRYLADEPVAAGPPSTRYRLKKFLRRNRGPVLAALLVLLALVGGIIGTTLGLLQARASEERAYHEAIKAGQERDSANGARDAEQKAKEAERAQRKLAEAARDRAADTLDAMTSYTVGGALTQQKVVTPEQKRFLAQAVVYYRDLMKEKPGDEATRKRLAAAAYRLGVIEYRLGRKQESAGMFREARNLYTKLATDFAPVPLYREGLAVSQTSLGLLLQDLGGWGQAETEHRAAIDVNQKLMAEFPTAPEYRDNLATSHHNLGIVLTESRQRDQAEAEYRAAIDLWKQLTAEFPAVPDYRESLAASDDDLGGLLADLGKRDQAEPEYRASIDLRKKLALEFPAVPDYRQGLARSHHNLGILLQSWGKWDQAEREFGAALHVEEKLTSEFPAVPANRRALAESHGYLGILLMQLGKRDRAETEYRAAIDLWKNLTAEFPNVTDYPIALGGGLCNLGHLVSDTDRLNDALGWYAQAIATLSPVIEKEPSHLRARQFLCNSLGGRAGTLDQLKRHAEAVDDWARAMDLAPGQEKVVYHRALMLSRVGAGRFGPALTDADLLAKSDSTDLLYDCACVYALVHAKTRDDMHAVRAVELLRQAIAKGFRDVAQLKKDADLDSLRERDDFRQLVADLEKNKAPRPPGT